MSEITRYANENTRRNADHLAQLYYEAKTSVAEWFANPSVQPNNDVTPIDDGSGDAGDGRHQLTGQKMHNIINRLSEFITAMEQPGVLNTVLNTAVNPTR